MSISTRKMLSVALVAVFAATSAASVLAAETQFDKNHPRRDQVNDRLKHQNKRIHREVREGDMSKAKAAKLHREDHQIRKEEHLMAAQHGGHITKQEQRTLNQQENSVGRQIGQ